MSTPTILVDKYREAAGRPSNDNAYRGHQIHALPGLHAFVGEIATKHLVPGARIVDLAAGTGAMSLRLQDMGFHPTAVDYVAENFRAQPIPFVCTDLNQRFSECLPQRVQGLIASEIIEHLENPRHFARECYRTLDEGGCVVLTTPNLQSHASKASFVRDDRFHWFSDRDYVREGHISPLAPWQLDKCFAEAGFERSWAGSFGDSLQSVRSSRRLQLLAKLIAWVSAGDAALHGEIYVAVYRRPVAGQEVMPPPPSDPGATGSVRDADRSD